MFYQVKFEHYPTGDTKAFTTHECIVNAPSASHIAEVIQKGFPEGYINILSFLEFNLIEGDIFEITKGENKMFFLSKSS